MSSRCTLLSNPDPVVPNTFVLLSCLKSYFRPVGQSCSTTSSLGDPGVRTLASQKIRKQPSCFVQRWNLVRSYDQRPHPFRCLLTKWPDLTRLLSVLIQYLDKDSGSLNDVKSRNVVTSKETETAVSVSCDVTTVLDLASFRHLWFVEMVLLRRNNAMIKTHCKKTHNRVKHRVWHTDRDATRPDPAWPKSLKQ